MKLPKYNLCYNTRDLIKSLAENANDRNNICVDLSFVVQGASVLGRNSYASIFSVIPSRLQSENVTIKYAFLC